MSDSLMIIVVLVAIAIGLALWMHLKRAAQAAGEGQAPAVEPPAACDAPARTGDDAIAPAVQQDAAAGFVKPEHVFFDSTVPARDDAIALLAHAAVELGIAADEDALVAAFLEREAEGTTGMMDGFAIPHAKSDTISRAAVLVLKNDSGIFGWETVDDKPVSVAIALLIPGEQPGAEHLRILSQVAGSLMDEGFRAAVRGATDSAQIADAINARLA